MEAGLARLVRQPGKVGKQDDFSCVYLRTFHPAYRDNFVVLTLFRQLLKIACGIIFELSSRQPG
jgi:hypothetical protein